MADNIVVDPAQPAVAAPAPVVVAEPVTDRTREQFEKLLDSNQRLFEQNEAMRREMQTKFTQTPAAPEKPAMLDFYQTDPTTGETLLNGEKLNARMQEIQKRAEDAEKQVQNLMKTSEEREIERQNKEAYGTFPELNPDAGDKFDKKFHQQVRGVLYDSMMNAGDYGGRPLSFREAAQFVKGEPITQPAVIAAPDNGEAQAAKEAAAQNIASQPAPQQHTLSDDDVLRDLQMKTRYGSDEALAKRLLHTEHILPKDAREVQD